MIYDYIIEIVCSGPFKDADHWNFIKLHLRCYQVRGKIWQIAYLYTLKAFQEQKRFRRLKSTIVLLTLCCLFACFSNRLPLLVFPLCFSQSTNRLNTISQQKRNSLSSFGIDFSLTTQFFCLSQTSVVLFQPWTIFLCYVLFQKMFIGKPAINIDENAFSKSIFSSVTRAVNETYENNCVGKSDYSQACAL